MNIEFLGWKTTWKLYFKYINNKHVLLSHKNFRQSIRLHIFIKKKKQKKNKKHDYPVLTAFSSIN